MPNRLTDSHLRRLARKRACGACRHRVLLTGEKESDGDRVSRCGAIKDAPKTKGARNHICKGALFVSIAIPPPQREPRGATKYCPMSAQMGEHACKDRAQCWEPCGALGKSEAHVQVATEEATAAIDAALGLGPCSARNSSDA